MTCAVLLASYNGEDYISEQVESILDQDYSDVLLFISDDDSHDATYEICKDYQCRYGEETICLTKNNATLGFCKNFLSLLYDPKIEADFYAFADQDDIWKNHKLSYAIAKLETISKDVPALYCSRTELVDSSGAHIGYSPLFTKPPSFRNALVQNIGGGNTMVLNNAARDVLLKARCKRLVSHDWWTYILIAGVGGVVIYDQEPKILYRQHAQNQIGANVSLFARLKRIKMLMQGRFCLWNSLNAQSLEEVLYLLTPENKKIFLKFARRNELDLWGRIRFLVTTGIYRQTYFGQIGLYVSACMNKF